MRPPRVLAVTVLAAALTGTLLGPLTGSAAAVTVLPRTAVASQAVETSALQRANRPFAWKFARRWLAPRPVAVPAPVPPAADPPAAMARRIAVLVNIERAAAGLRPLQVSTCATGYATTWSAAMARTGTFAHQSLRPLLTSCQATGAGENIAYGARSAEEFMTLWMNSAGHRANILRPEYTHLGVGLARSASGTLYATQDFLTR